MGCRIIGAPIKSCTSVHPFWSDAPTKTEPGVLEGKLEEPQPPQQGHSLSKQDNMSPFLTTSFSFIGPKKFQKAEADLNARSADIFQLLKK